MKKMCLTIFAFKINKNPLGRATTPLGVTKWKQSGAQGPKDLATSDQIQLRSSLAKIFCERKNHDIPCNFASAANLQE